MSLEASGGDGLYVLAMGGEVDGPGHRAVVPSELVRRSSLPGALHHSATQSVSWTRTPSSVALRPAKISPFGDAAGETRMVNAIDKQHSSEMYRLTSISNAASLTDGEARSEARFWLSILGLYMGARSNELFNVEATKLKQDGQTETCSKSIPTKNSSMSAASTRSVIRPRPDHTLVQTAMTSILPIDGHPRQFEASISVATDRNCCGDALSSVVRWRIGMILCEACRHRG